MLSACYREFSAASIANPDFDIGARVAKSALETADGDQQVVRRKTDCQSNNACARCAGLHAHQVNSLARVVEVGAREQIVSPTATVRFLCTVAAVAVANEEPADGHASSDAFHDTIRTELAATHARVRALI